MECRFISSPVSYYYDIFNDKFMLLVLHGTSVKILRAKRMVKGEDISSSQLSIVKSLMDRKIFKRTVFQKVLELYRNSTCRK